MKTSLNTAKYFLGSYSHQAIYVRNCQDDLIPVLQELRSVIGPFRGLELIHLKYVYGVKKGWLSLSYQEFEDKLFGREKDDVRFYPRYYYRSPKWLRDYMRHLPYRRGKGYVRSVDHLPKEESPKAAWREHKRFKKDKCPKHWANGTRTRNFFKNYDNRQRRRRDAQLLQKGDYESIPYISKVDPWMWD